MRGGSRDAAAGMLQLGCCGWPLPCPPRHGPGTCLQGPHPAPETLLQALFPAPPLLFHPLLIPFPLSGLSCPGNDSPLSSASHCTGPFPTLPDFQHHPTFKLDATETSPPLGLALPPCEPPKEEASQAAVQGKAHLQMVWGWSLVLSSAPKPLYSHARAPSPCFRPAPPLCPTVLLLVPSGAGDPRLHQQMGQKSQGRGHGGCQLPRVSCAR